MIEQPFHDFREIGSIVRSSERIYVITLTSVHQIKDVVLLP